MAEDGKAQDLMGYEAMAQEALRGVIKAALKRAAEPQGLPGDHHFYITFKTHGAGVTAPADLAEKYPDEMTIVLQHQYWDLAPGETFFAITLRFGGQPKTLSVPYAAITRFYDPSIQFLRQFEAADAPAPAVSTHEVVPMRPRLAGEGDAPQAAPTEAQLGDGGDDGPDDGPKVVSLDRFRKK
ncbi:ClpXP protease specificity-enhancing factor SspB [soil metagenome]